MRQLASICAALPDAVARNLGLALGALRRRARPGEVAHVRANLRALALGRPDAVASPETAERIERDVAATFQSFGLFAIEFLRGLALSPAQIIAGWEISGAEHLERLAGRRRGFLLAGAHTGNWEQLGAIAALLGRRIVAPVETQLHPCISPAIKRAKARWGVVSLPARGGWRGLLGALEGGALVALPLDGGEYRRGSSVPLGPARLRLARGAARLARLANCPILPLFSQRTAFMRQRVRVLPPLAPPRRDDRRGEESLHVELARLLYLQLRRSPGQWCLFRRLPWYNCK